MYYVNDIFWVAVNVIMSGSYFRSGRKGIICAAIVNIAASDAIFAASEGSFSDDSLFISTWFRSN